MDTAFNVQYSTLEIVTTSIRSCEQSLKYKSPSNAGTNKYLKYNIKYKYIKSKTLAWVPVSKVKSLCHYWSRQIMEKSINYSYIYLRSAVEISSSSSLILNNAKSLIISIALRKQSIASQMQSYMYAICTNLIHEYACNQNL